jgi:translation initiation factor 3 subunit H
MIDALDSYKSEENNLAYLSRQIARERVKADAHVAKRKEENALRASQGLPALPEDDVNRLFKIPPEPSRMESVLLLGQIDAVAQDLDGLVAAEMVKMYAARAGSA